MKGGKEMNKKVNYFSGILFAHFAVVLCLASVGCQTMPYGESSDEATVYYAAPADYAFAGRERGTEAAPWRSLSKAIKNLRPGDTLILLPGTYKQSVDIFHGGVPGKEVKILGRGTVLFEGLSLNEYHAVIHIRGASYLQLKNIDVINARAAVMIDRGEHIRIEDVGAGASHFTVLMIDAAFIEIENAYAKNNRNGFRAVGKTHDVVMRYIKTTGSKDTSDGYDKSYLNGDGIIFEAETYNLTFEHIKSSDHWDSGLDIKGDNVVIENVILHGNKNGLKLWGENVKVRNALIFDSLAQEREDGDPIDGVGINIHSGDTIVERSTIVNNERIDLKVSEDGVLTVKKSIIARQLASGRLVGPWGKFHDEENIWYAPDMKTLGSFKIGKRSKWLDPRFRDEDVFYPVKESPAFVRGEQVFGAY